MKITRKEAEDISFGLGGMLYKEEKYPNCLKRCYWSIYSKKEKIQFRLQSL